MASNRKHIAAEATGLRISMPLPDPPPPSASPSPTQTRSAVPLDNSVASVVHVAMKRWRELFGAGCLSLSLIAIGGFCVVSMSAFFGGSKGEIEVSPTGLAHLGPQWSGRWVVVVGEVRGVRRGKGGAVEGFTLMDGVGGWIQFTGIGGMDEVADGMLVGVEGIADIMVGDVPWQPRDRLGGARVVWKKKQPVLH